MPCGRLRRPQVSNLKRQKQIHKISADKEFLPRSELNMRNVKFQFTRQAAIRYTRCYKPFYLNKFSSSNIRSDFITNPKLFGIREIAIGLCPVGMSII
jgi:hypothetical protein